MKISRTTYRISAIAGTIGVALALAAPLQASSSKPAGMSKAEYRALLLPSQALNKRYHLGAYQLPRNMTAAEYRALMLRSAALNKRYQPGSGAVSAASTTASTDSGFAWSAFGIGSASMLALVLLASAAIVGTRHGRRAPQPRVSS